MKEATGEGSMTVVTIVVIVGLLAAAAAIVLIMTNKAKSSTSSISDSGVDVCPDGYTLTDGKCKLNAVNP